MLGADNVRIRKGITSRRKATHEIQAEALYPRHDWSWVRAGGCVTVQDPDGHAYMAWVDTKSDDSTFVWLVSTEEGRKLYGNWEAIRISPDLLIP